jgi:hypothetical protein
MTMVVKIKATIARSEAGNPVSMTMCWRDEKKYQQIRLN